MTHAEREADLRRQDLEHTVFVPLDERGNETLADLAVAVVNNSIRPPEGSMSKRARRNFLALHSESDDWDCHATDVAMFGECDSVA